MSKFLLLLALVFMLGSCSSSRDTQTDSRKDVTVPASVTAFEIYFTGADSIRVQQFVELAKTRLVGFSRVGQFPDSITQDSYTIKRYTTASDEFVPPDLEYLSYSGVGLSEDEMIKLQGAGSGLAINFFSTKGNIIEKQRNITSLIQAAVQGPNNFVGDLNTRRYYSASSWKSERVDEFIGDDMLNEITLHIYRDGEFCRMVSLGMGKFCLPDISLKEIACSDQNTYASLVNAVVATWLSSPTIDADSTVLIDLQKVAIPTIKEYLTSDIKEGAEQTAELKLKFVEPEEGDNHNRQFRIVFENPEFSSPQEEQNEILKKLFGFKESYTKISHNEELLAASKRAKEKLPTMQVLFNKGLEPGYSLFLKAPFKTDDGGNEWMWIEVSKWTGSTIEGILQNEPYEISGLKSGAKVTVNQEDIFDYLLNKPDGTSEGNETGKIIESMN